MSIMQSIRSTVDFIEKYKKYMNPVTAVKAVADEVVKSVSARRTVTKFRTAIKWKKETSKSATLAKLAPIMRNDAKKGHRLISKLEKISKQKGAKELIKVTSNKLGGVVMNNIQDLATLKVGTIRGTLFAKTAGFLQKASKLKALAPVIKVFKPVAKFVGKYGSRKLGAMGLAVSGSFIAVDAASGNTRSAVVGTASTAAATVGGPYGVAASLVIDEANAKLKSQERASKDLLRGKFDVIDGVSQFMPATGLGSELAHDVADAMGINTKITFDAKRARQAKETEAMLRKLQAQGKIDKNVTLNDLYSHTTCVTDYLLKDAKVNKHKDTNQPDKKVAQNTRKAKRKTKKRLLI